jgi:hypothetical protein
VFWCSCVAVLFFVVQSPKVGRQRSTLTYKT